MNSHAQILIIGAGPAGLSAALAAAEDGAQVVLIDDNPQPGGQIWRVDRQSAPARQGRRLLDRVRAQANIYCHNATRVVARSGAKALLLENPQSGWRIRYEKLILCTGAQELLLPFPGWTLPGVTGAGGLQALLKGGLPIAGERLVIAGSGPLLLACAATASSHGAQVLRIAEQAKLRSIARFALQLPRWPHKLVQSFGLLDRSYRSATRIVAALGHQRLEAVRLLHNGVPQELECERLACGFGLIANVRLGLALGCALDGNAIRVDAWQASSVPDIYAAGECTGLGGSELAQVEGAIAGHVAAGNPAAARRLWRRRHRWQGFADEVNAHFVLDPAHKHLAEPDTLLCRCEDVPYAAVAGHTHWRAAKLATRCGMGACQGRICGSAATQLFGWQPSTPRAPISPARIATLMQHPPPHQYK
jgi:NADPH-dependent 2,4-dienoyl-CoA reductase/sulfur reductase-like enzyme